MIKVEVVTPERIVHETEGDEIIIPTLEGEIGVRKGHLPLIAPIKSGEVIVKTDKGGEQSFAVHGGFVEVMPDSVRILADSAVRAEELDEKAIREAIARAKTLKEQAADEIALADVTALMEANLARLRILERKKSRSHRAPRPGGDGLGQ